MYKIINYLFHLVAEMLMHKGWKELGLSNSCARPFYLLNIIETQELMLVLKNAWPYEGYYDTNNY